MTSQEIREKFIKFFEEKGHKVVPSASLIPENDPTVLFTTAGMHPLVPYLIGEKHPQGKRIVSCQKCFRTGDIDEVGNTNHQTFFEMLGNWSFGDYWKKEAIEWSFEFLTSKKWLNIPINRLAVSVFKGDKDASFDEESFDIWKRLGISEERIAKLSKKDNWWGPAGETGPCGPDTEMFFWKGSDPAPKKFDPDNSTKKIGESNWVEIWNDVFMEYNKTANGKFEPLKQKNVDTGMGLERTLTVLGGYNDNYKTDLFSPIIKKIEKISGKKYEESKKVFRVITDHIKAAAMLIADGAFPSNKDQGYIVRRLIRRAVVKANGLGIKENFADKLAGIVIGIYDGVYQINQELVISELKKEESKFRKTLERGLKFIDLHKDVNGKILFDLYQTYGIPLEISREEYQKKNIDIDGQITKQFQDEVAKHQEKSRVASAGKFKGGLADSSEETIRLHTAAHLLLAALQQILGDQVVQKGSNITPERLRFDFSHGEKMSEKEIEKVEKMVNDVIKKDLPVICEEVTVEEAKKQGARVLFLDKYKGKVTMYSVGDFSCELCKGPHVKRTGELGKFKIQKEESSSAGVRRIRAILE